MQSLWNSMTTRVLIVDDHPDIRTLLCATLEDDYEVLQARDGDEALEIAQREQPDAVLLDITIPGELNGFGVLKAIKTNERTRSIPVAMVTARGQQADILLCESYGADAYFCKPFSPGALLSWLHKRCPE